MTERSRLLTDWLLLAGFCGFLFFFGLAHFGLVGADEPRYAQIAREMLARQDWITPTLDGKPWLEKPALYYWQAMLAYRIFGVSDWAARPSCVRAGWRIDDGVARGSDWICARSLDGYAAQRCVCDCAARLVRLA